VSKNRVIPLRARGIGRSRKPKNSEPVTSESVRTFFVANLKNGPVPRVRHEIFPTLKKLKVVYCPFKNLPEKRASRWGESLTAEKMNQCRWVTPKLVCQVAFVEWTDAGHLRHWTFIGLRDDRKAAEVVRET
jgi:hypothetical protein